MPDVRIQPTEMPLLTGDETILPGTTMRDFWAWALGDLRLNANRGMLARFLVARACEIAAPRRRRPALKTPG